MSTERSRISSFFTSTCREGGRFIFEGHIPAFSTVLPRLGLAALILCILSGVILTFQYRPFGNVFKNLEEITSLIPYGWFFRQIHYITGQAFVFLMLLHTADHFIRRRYRVYAPGEWTNLTAALLACFFALFTGFILKGDKEGLFAGKILASILDTIPRLGKGIAGLLVGSEDDFFFLPYLHHCFFIPLLVGYLLKDHIRDWLPGKGFMAAAGILAASYALVVAPFIDIPPDAPAEAVTGPWFFLGIQSLLRNWPVFPVGILLPLIFVLLVLILPLVSSMSTGGSRKAMRAYYLLERVIYWIILAAAFSYLLLVLSAALKGP